MDPVRPPRDILVQEVGPYRQVLTAAGEIELQVIHGHWDAVRMATQANAQRLLEATQAPERSRMDGGRR